MTHKARKKRNLHNKHRINKKKNRGRNIIPAASKLACETVLDNPPTTGIHEGQISYKLGFVPDQLKLTLPKEYAIWESYQAKLSEWIQSGKEREELAKLPLLEANDPSKLPNECLGLAASILANFAHIYYFNVRKGETQAEDPLPDSIRIPWEQVNARLGRKLLDNDPKKIKAARTQYDVLLSNWKSKKEITGENNLTLEINDLALINAPFNNREERVFNLAIVLMELRFAPALKQFIKALKAVKAGDDNALIEALANVTHVLDRVTNAIHYINSNPNSEHYIDPIIWTKTIAIVDKPLPEGQPGLSANLMPMFHAMDTFIERYQYDTALAKSILQRFQVQPEHIFNFLTALKSDLELNSIRNYVETSNNQVLKNQYQALLDAYVGPKGFLSAHKLKALGVLKINFRSGRLQTNGGMKGTATIETEPQRKVFDDFTVAMLERYGHYQHFPYTAVKVNSKALDKEAKAYEIVLDIKDSGIQFMAGDRCAIQALNCQKTIDILIADLKLDAQSEIKLTSAWKNYFLHVFGKELDVMRLGEFLKYVDIQHARSLSASQRFNIENLKPLAPRMYSVSPIPGHPDQIGLTVGKHVYTLNNKTLQGTASQYLIELDANMPVVIERVPAHFFRLPPNPKKPIMMFAGGTGIAPFLGFIHERQAHLGAGKNWLFYSATNKDAFYYQERLKKAVKENDVELSMVFTRDDKVDTAVYNKKRKKFKYSKKYNEQHPHIDVLIKENAKEICRLIQEEGAYIYVCGNTGFADCVRKAIEKEMAATIEHPEKYIDRLIADKRYNNDVFNSHYSSNSEHHYSRSEVACHNKYNDCWMIINGHVYDLTRFMTIHPGGSKILQVTAGSDGSDDYNHISHHKNQEIEGQLATYEIGTVDEPVFTKKELSKTYKTLLYFLSALLEMQNTLMNNTNFAVNGTPPMYLWNEVMSVFFDGRLAAFDSHENMGSFKYTFGKLLNDICELANIPPLELKNLFDKASACGAYLKKASINVSPEELKRVEEIYKIILSESLKLINDTKEAVILLCREMEKHTDSCDIDKVLPCAIQKINNNMVDYIKIIDHIHAALNLGLNENKPSVSVVASPCIYAKMMLNGRAAPDVQDVKTASLSSSKFCLLAKKDVSEEAVHPLPQAKKRYPNSGIISRL